VDRTKADGVLTQALFLMDRPRLGREIVKDPSKLRDLFVEIMRITCPELNFDADPAGDTQIDISGSASGKMSVQRLHSLLDPNDIADARRKIVTHIIEMAVVVSSLQGDGAAVEGDVIALVRAGEVLRDYEAGLAAQRGPDVDANLIRWEVGGDVHAVVVLDGERGYSYVGQDYLTMMNITEEALREKAVATLKARLGTTPPEFDFSEHGTVMVSGYDNLASSLLVLPEVWQSLREKLDDDLLIHVIDKTELVVVGKGNPASILSVLGLVISGECPSFYPGRLFAFDDDGLVALESEKINEIIESALSTTMAPVRSGPLN